MSDTLEKDVKEIKWRVEGMEKSIDLLIRANRKEIIADIMRFFGKSIDRVKVFIEIDGEKTVKQVSEALRMQPENVSKRTTELADEGLIQVKKTTREGKVYEKTYKVKTLNLDKLLRKEFKIPDDHAEKEAAPEETTTDAAGEHTEK